MKWLNWRDACKFLSGVAFAESLMDFYLFVCRKSIPFIDHVVMDDALGQKAALLLGVFGALFYLGFYSSQPRSAANTSEDKMISLVNPAGHVA